MSSSNISSRPEESRSQELRNVLIIFPTIATVAVVLRLITRTLVVKNIGIEDWCMALALVFSWLASSLDIVSTVYGMGRHVWDLTSDQLIQGQKYAWVAELASIMAFFFVKIAIALLLLRIIEVKKGYTYFLYATMIINFVSSTVWLILTFQCIPFSAVWDPALQSIAHCIPRDVVVYYGYGAGALHSALDFTYVILPIYLIWNIQLPLQRKIGLTLLLSVGVFAVIASIIKVTYSSDLGQTSDPTWNFTDLSQWNIIEMNTGIVVGCIPPVRPLFVFCYRQTATRLGYGTSGGSTRPEGSTIRDSWSGARRRRIGGWISRTENTHPLELSMFAEYSASTRMIFGDIWRGHEAEREKDDIESGRRGESSFQTVENKEEENHTEDEEGERWQDCVSRQSSRDTGMAKDFEAADQV